MKLLKSLKIILALSVGLNGLVLSWPNPPLSFQAIKREVIRVTREDEITLMKWTIAMEAEGEPFEGKLAVAHVIMNRVNKWKKSVADVCLKGFQFSAWNADSPTRLRLDDISDQVMEESYKAAVQAY